MEAPKTIEEYNQQIAQVRAASHKRRAEAWAMVPETVLGLELNPITPAIYSILMGTGNAYLCGKVPTEADLRNFVWFCSPRFNPDKPIESNRWRSLRMWQLNRAMRKGATLAKFSPAIIKNFYTACFQIQELVKQTFRDSAGGGGAGEPLAASLEARLLDTFAREYQMWPLPKPVRHTPIKQLYQLLRCIDRNAYGTEDCYYDTDEVKITESFLAEANAKN